MDTLFKKCSKLFLFFSFFSFFSSFAYFFLRGTDAEEKYTLGYFGYIIMFPSIYILYYYYYILPNLIKKHNSCKNLPYWFNQERHLDQFLKRHDETSDNLNGFEGVTSWFAVNFCYIYLCNWIFNYKTVLYYIDWIELEKVIDNQIYTLPTPINDYDVILGVDYGGAVCGEYIYKKYSIPEIGYLRPRKKRSSFSLFFLVQLLLSYSEMLVYFCMQKKNTRWLPYFTDMESCDIPFDTNGKRILIVDDGTLSGGTIASCLDFMNNFYSFIQCDIVVIHGIQRNYNNKLKDTDFICYSKQKKNIISIENKVHVFQGYQLCYMPWGQT